MAAPPTRQTLLLRIRDGGDEPSWAEFVEIYTPVLYNFCRARGLQPADASDVVQDVMRILFRSLRSFEYDPKRGTFRSWLFTITRREVNRHLKRLANRETTGSDSGMVRALEDTPDPREEQDWEFDYRLQMFRWASEKIRGEFRDDHWDAFTRTAIGSEPAEAVAESLGLTRAAVYLARSRITKRLRETILSVAAESWELDAAKEKDSPPDKSAP